MKKKIRSICITPNQAEWLKVHPEINLSGLVQKALQDYISKLEPRLVEKL